MKKTLLLAGVATLVFAANANAFDYKQYVSAKANYSFDSHDMKYRAVWPTEPNQKGKIDFTDNVWGGAVAYGIKAGSVRTELELNLKKDAKKDFHSSSSTAELSVANKFAMINAYYDIDTGTKLTPYIGAGLGMAYLKAEERGTYASGDYTSAIASDSRKTLAWQIGAGVSYSLNNQFNVDFGYRYLDEGHVAYRDDNSINRYEAKAHELSLGVRYTF